MDVMWSSLWQHVLGGRPFNRVRARWNDDLCAFALMENSVVGWVAIIGSIGRELADVVAATGVMFIRHAGPIKLVSIATEQAQIVDSLFMHQSLYFA